MWATGDDCIQESQAKTLLGGYKLSVNYNIVGILIWETDKTAL